MKTVESTVAFEFDPFSYEAHIDPYPMYRILREKYPLYRNERRDFWALSRFADVQNAARDWETFSNANGVDLDKTGSQIFGTGDFLDMDPPRHDLLRDVIRRRFAPKEIQKLELQISQHVEHLLEVLSSTGQVDLATELGWSLPIATVCGLLGLPVEDTPLLQDLFSRALEREIGNEKIPESALEAASRIREYFAAAVADRQVAPRDDVLSGIATAEVDGAPLGEEAVGMSFLLLSAGTDTAASLISNSLLLLDQHRDLRTALIRDESQMPAAIEEILRYWSPVQNVIRTTTRDVEVHGEIVPVGARVVLLYGSANRDGERFDDPDRLDFKRPTQRTLAFGEGIHFCLGAPLARLEARIAVSKVLNRYPDYEVDGPIVRMAKQNAWGLAHLPARLA